MLCIFLYDSVSYIFFFSSRRRHTRCSGVRGLGDVYKRQVTYRMEKPTLIWRNWNGNAVLPATRIICLLYTSDAADDLTRVDLGGRRIIKKKKKKKKKKNKNK